MNSGEVLGDGGYSRVYAMSQHKVLKVSSCAATAELLRELQVLTALNGLPMHLPRVYTSFGVVATDADGKAFEGFVVERLFQPQEYCLRLRARQSRRSHGIEDYGNITLKADESLRLFEAARSALDWSSVEHCEGRYEGWVESTSMAGFLAATPDFPLQDARATFSLLESFVQRNRCELDLRTKGNLLVNAVGVPVLADPVAEVVTPIDNPEFTEEVPSMQGKAVMELRPTEVRGLRVHFRWVTLAHAETDEDAVKFVKRRKQTFPHARDYCVVNWRGKAHDRLMEDTSMASSLEELRPATRIELKLPAGERHPDLAGLKLTKQARRFIGADAALRLLAQQLRKVFGSCLPDEDLLQADVTRRLCLAGH